MSSSLKYLTYTLNGATPEGRLDLHTSDQSIYLKESGLYQLIFKSNMPKAKGFTRWIAEQVLPTLRVTGSYTLSRAMDNYNIRNERDLHYRVIHFIKRHYPEAIVAPSLGEYQTSEGLRLDAYNKGYKGGQPDIIILNLFNF